MPTLKVKKNGTWEQVLTGGNADTVDGKHADEFALKVDLGDAAYKSVLNSIADYTGEEDMVELVPSLNAVYEMNNMYYEDFVQKSEFDPSDYLPLAGGTMTGVINMGSQKITSLATPTAAADAANKTYVDSRIIISAEAPADTTALWIDTDDTSSPSSGVTDIFYAGTTAPENTKLLWIDPDNGLKYYNGSAWTHVPVAWS